MWSGGNYTKGNSATGGWTGDQSLGIGIEAGRHDTQDDDFATGINQCLNKDGSNAATGNLNLGGYRPTNIASGTAAAPAICAGNDTNTGMFSAGADVIGFATNGAERVRIDDAGRVGIGTTTPANLVDVQAAAEVSAAFTRYTNDASPFRFDIFKNRGAALGTNTIVQNNDAIGQIRFYGANGTNYTQAAEIRASIDGTPGASTDMPGRLQFFTTPDAAGGTVERMRITNNGRIGINQPSPSSTLTLVNNESAAINTANIQSNVTGDLATHALVVTKFDNSTATTQRYIGFLMDGGASSSGQINANGANAAAFGSFSDERLKENIVDLPSQIDNFRALRPVEFDYKDGSGHQLGFIAQEVQAIFPDLVGESDGYLTLTDMNKNDARLIKAFQELINKVDTLETRIAALEGA